jgi:hypothetical protein
MRHKHADLIHLWAEGVEIEWLNGDNTWETAIQPAWHKSSEYRIKPKQPEWYENIPEHGVLCWVSDREKHPDKHCWLRIVDAYRHDDLYPFKQMGQLSWLYATPLTDDEIRQYLRGEK